MATVKFEIRWNNIPGFLADMPRVVRRAGRESAEAIRAGAAQRSRVDTGAMKAGWRVVEDKDGITVDNPVPYTIFNEYGTVNMTSQPMLTPAVEEERGNFPARLVDALNALANDHGR